MPDKPSNPFNFWHELKRRKVIRVIVIYAASALAILEAVDIIFPRMGFPDWTITFVIFLLIIGFAITIILSWIYDVTPEGIEKTKPVDEIKEKVPEKPSQLKAWKIATIISIVIIIGLIIFNIFGRRERSEELVILDKSIAVRPFWNESTEKENEFFVNGMTEDIRNNLSKIADLRVLSRGSVEIYRNPQYSTKDIAKDLDVTYVLEGTAQRIGNHIKIHVQLILAEIDDHVWDTSYAEIIDAKRVYNLQSRIAQSVANEIKAVITTEEKQLIEKIPTLNLTAHDFYQRAIEEHRKHWLKWNDMEAVERAEDLYQRALEYDSTFALAYEGLANVYWHKHYGDVLSENYLDSMLILLNIALSFDDQLASAYVKRGDYYRVNNDKEQAIKEYDKALKINPNDRVVYMNSTIGLYDDEVIIIEYLLKAASLNKGYHLPRLYRRIAIYTGAYSKKKSNYYLEEALKLDDDSADHFHSLARIEHRSGNFEKSIEYGKKSYALDSTMNNVIYRLGVNHSYLGQYEESLEYFKKYDKRLTTPIGVDIKDKFRIGYAYWMNGFKEEAEYYINEGLRIYDRMLELNRISPQDFSTLYGFAAVHAFRGEKDKAYEYLRLLYQTQWMKQQWVNVLNYDPMFDNIRDEPEFQQIVRDMEAKYQAEHERVRQWLEENDML